MPSLTRFFTCLGWTYIVAAAACWALGLCDWRVALLVAACGYVAWIETSRTQEVVWVSETLNGQ